MFKSKARVAPLKGRLLALLANIRIGRKGLAETYTLVYLAKL
jgi:hypothetical protein